jgi:hypothetical protein
VLTTNDAFVGAESMSRKVSSVSSSRSPLIFTATVLLVSNGRNVSVAGPFAV